MACGNYCKICNRMTWTTAVTFADDALTLVIPDNTFDDGEKVCIVIAQQIPEEATINAPVFVAFEGGTTPSPLVTVDGMPVIASALHRRTRYATKVHTTATGGVYRLLAHICNENGDVLPFINQDT